MDFKLKLVNNIPLQRLWNNNGYVIYERGSNLSTKEVISFFDSSVRYIIADLGKELYWIPEDDFYKQWKEEIKERLVANTSKIDLDAFPKNYAFIASKWINEENSMIILFEKIH